jgi:hypothetical protein
MPNEPQDLCPPAIKAARRIQALPSGRLHLVAVIKMLKVWFLFVLSREGVKMEKLEG